MGAFPGLFHVIGLQVVPIGDKSVSIVSLPFAALAFFLGLKVIGSAIVPRRPKSPKSNASSIATMLTPDPSPGRQRPIQYWKKSSDYVSVFPGHNTAFRALYKSKNRSAAVTADTAVTSACPACCSVFRLPRVIVESRLRCPQSSAARPARAKPPEMSLRSA
jgi:hypothetical protein